MACPYPASCPAGCMWSARHSSFMSSATLMRAKLPGKIGWCGAYAFAVAEENAGGGVIVTAPTCGACGVLPSALRYMQEQKGFSDEQVLRALARQGWWAT